MTARSHVECYPTTSRFTIKTEDETLSGSIHILDLADPSAAGSFAFEEPGYRAGACGHVLVRPWRNSLGLTMWDSRRDPGTTRVASFSGSR